MVSCPAIKLAERIKALNIARTTTSDVTVRELKRLHQQLASYARLAVEDFREA